MLAARIIRKMYGTTTITSVSTGSTSICGSSHGCLPRRDRRDRREEVEHVRREHEHERDRDRELRQRRHRRATRPTSRGPTARSRRSAANRTEQHPHDRPDHARQEHEHRRVHARAARPICPTGRCWPTRLVPRSPRSSPLEPIPVLLERGTIQTQSGARARRTMRAWRSGRARRTPRCPAAPASRRTRSSTRRTASGTPAACAGSAGRGRDAPSSRCAAGDVGWTAAGFDVLNAAPLRVRRSRDGGPEPVPLTGEGAVGDLDPTTLLVPGRGLDQQDARAERDVEELRLALVRGARPHVVVGTGRHDPIRSEAPYRESVA